jgi:hypothetical protein
MSGISETADAIRDTVAAVTNVGNVFDYQPYPQNNWDEFVALFSLVVNGKLQVRTWTVQYLGERREELAIGIGATKQRRYMQWMVRGHMGHNGATSDVEFRDLIELVANALDSNRGLAGVAGVMDHDPCDVSLPNNAAGVVLGDVLCHYVEITFESQHEQNITLV